MCPSRVADPGCFPQVKAPIQTDPSLGTTYFIGFALDGFPIIVVIDQNGNVVADYNNLDECGGKVRDRPEISAFSTYADNIS